MCYRLTVSARLLFQDGFPTPGVQPAGRAGRGAPRGMSEDVVPCDEQHRNQVKAFRAVIGLIKHVRRFSGCAQLAESRENRGSRLEQILTLRGAFLLDEGGTKKRHLSFLIVWILATSTVVRELAVDKRDRRSDSARLADKKHNVCVDDAGGTSAPGGRAAPPVDARSTMQRSPFSKSHDSQCARRKRGRERRVRGAGRGVRGTGRGARGGQHTAEAARLRGARSRGRATRRRSATLRVVVMSSERCRSYDTHRVDLESFVCANTRLLKLET